MTLIKRFKSFYFCGFHGKLLFVVSVWD